MTRLLPEPSRIAAASAFVVVLGLPVGASLAEIVPNLLDTPFFPERAVSKSVAVELPAVRVDSAARAPYRHHATLRAEAVDRLLRHPELRLVVGTYLTYPRLESAELKIDGTDCAYRTNPEDAVRNNEELSFVRGRNCIPLQGWPTGTMSLEVRVRNRARFALWTAVLKDPAPSAVAPEMMTVDQEGSQPLFIRGRFVDRLSGPGIRRIELLNYMWQVAPQPYWLWTTVTAALLIGMIGVAALPVTIDHRHVRRASGGVFALTFGVALLYAVLIPPFHAPDESSHFLSYGRFVQNQSLLDDSSWLVRVGHFERIQFHPRERFRPADIGHWYDVGWDDVVFKDVRFRSATTYWLWTAVSRYLRSDSTGLTLITFRLLHALVLAVAIGIGTAIIVTCTSAPYAYLAPVILLSIPTMPFFGVHLSNYAILTAVYSVLALSLVALYVGSRRIGLAGFLFGLAAALTLATSRSALPIVALCAAVSFARIVTGPRHDPGGASFRDALRFWGCTGMGALLGVGAMNREYASELLAVGGVRIGSARIALMLACAAAAGTMALAEGVIQRVKRTRAGAAHPPRRGIVRALAWMAGLVLLIELLGSLWFDYPVLRPMQPGVAPSPRAYVLEVLRCAVTWSRLENQDFLLSTSFWGAFGWLDTIPSQTLVSGLAAATACALAYSLFRIGRAYDGRRLVWLVTIGTGWLVAFVLYALGCARIAFDLHGRYLAGLYFCMIAIAWTPLIEPAAAWEERAAWPRPFLILVGCAAVHAVCLCGILARYF